MSFIRFFDTHQTSQLTSSGIDSVDELFMSPTSTLTSALQLSESIIQTRISALSLKYCPKSQSALQLRPTPSVLSSLFVTTGLRVLDDYLGGGFKFGTINEIVGAHGVGKSQFCLNCCATLLCSHSQQPISVIYVDTELKFDPVRFAQVLSNKLKSVGISDEAIPSLLSKVQVRRPSSCEEFLELIDRLEHEMISTTIPLIIVDSIAALPRNEMLDSVATDRFLLQITKQLKLIGDRFHAAILATNQVMISRVESDLDVTPNVRPVCGPTWHHCVTSRLVLSEKDDKLELSLTKNPSRPMRIMRVCVNEMGMEAAST